jgi:hypothetical protein
MKKSILLKMAVLKLDQDMAARKALVLKGDLPPIAAELPSVASNRLTTTSK